MAGATAAKEAYMRLLREYNAGIIPRVDAAAYRHGELVLTWWPKRYAFNPKVNFRLYIDPETLINKYNIYIIPENEEELEELIPIYLKKVGADDELVVLLTQYFVMAARWHPRTVKKHLEMLLGVRFRVLLYSSSDPCSGEIMSDVPEVIEDAVTLWEWRGSYGRPFDTYGESWTLELRFSPELNRLVLYYEHLSGDIRESSRSVYVALWPPLGVEIKRTRTRVVCGPDGYSTEIHETITL